MLTETEQLKGELFTEKAVLHGHITKLTRELEAARVRIAELEASEKAKPSRKCAVGEKCVKYTDEVKREHAILRGPFVALGYDDIDRAFLAGYLEGEGDAVVASQQWCIGKLKEVAATYRRLGKKNGSLAMLELAKVRAETLEDFVLVIERGQ